MKEERKKKSCERCTVNNGGVCIIERTAYVPTCTRVSSSLSLAQNVLISFYNDTSLANVPI